MAFLGPSPTRQAVDAALGDSIFTPKIIDVQFQLYSRRRRDGTIGTPEVAYGNSAVLRAASPYFQTLLEGGFAEAARSPCTIQERNLPGTAEAYGYESDSDLDDDEAEPPSVAGKNARDDRPILEEAPSPLHSTAQAAHHTVSTIKSVAIPDVAVRTWRALLYYIYTEKVTFAKLRSQPVSASNTSTFSLFGRAEGPREARLTCSPKSMYRLADKIGLDVLKQHALRDVQAKLTRSNIVDEIFSTLSAQYSQLLKMELIYFKTYCLSEFILPVLDNKLAEMAAGRLPHAAPSASALFAQMMSSISALPSSPEGAGCQGDGSAQAGAQRPVSGPELFGQSSPQGFGRFGSTASAGSTPNAAFGTSSFGSLFGSRSTFGQGPPSGSAAFPSTVFGGPPPGSSSSQQHAQGAGSSRATNQNQTS